MTRTLLRTAVTAAWLLASTGAWAAKPTGQIMVSTDPSGADVLCDGTSRGASPATVSGLGPGAHLVVVRKDGFLEARRTVMLEAGQKAAVELKLEALLGLVLVHSTPTGAEVAVNGAFRGVTPMFIPDFPAGTHRLRLTLPGHFPKELEVTVQDRIPQKADVELTPDTVALEVDSEPQGGTVVVNGASRGVTPCQVDKIPSGEIQIEVQLAGYQPYREKASLQAGDSYKVNAKLSATPGALQVVTIPDRARVYIDNQFRGEAPVTLSGLAPGTYRVRVEMTGFEADARSVEVKAGAQAVEEFRLAGNSGTLLLVTDPADVQVFIDGQDRGRTASAAAGSVSEPLRLDGLARGEHTLQLTRRGYSYTPRKIAIAPNQVVSLTEKLTRLFIPDVRLLVKIEGREQFVTGVLLQSFPDGSVEVEIRPGVVAKYEKADLVSREPLRPEP